jgi:hypothetical protein
MSAPRTHAIAEFAFRLMLLALAVLWMILPAVQEARPGPQAALQDVVK